MLIARNINHAIYPTIAYLFTWITIVVCIDNPYRSVEKCIDQSGQLWTEASCGYYCETRYINTSFGTARANKRVFHHQVRELKGGQTSQCCCRFNFPWPNFVRPRAVDRVHNGPRKMARPYDCYPLTVKFGLSSRTIDAYKRICEYLERRMPVTMLEAMDFANLTAYLNMMQPKNPMILRTIGHKKMKLVNKEVLARLEEVLTGRDNHVFLNSFKPLDEFEGYQLTTKVLKEMGNLLKYHLADARKNELIGKALDEYVLSYAVVDVMAAAKKVHEMNEKLLIPHNLIRGDYDQYNEENELAYFKLNSELDCKTLYWTQNRLNIYLSVLSTTLSSLNIKGAYEHMSEVNANLISLQHSQKIYKLLDRANCRRTPIKG